MQPSKYNIIFLDIDGVLATENDAEQEWHEQFAYPFDKGCVAVFNELLHITGAEIILSSDWKISYSDDLIQLDQLFRHNGIAKSPMGVTPDLGGNRNKEIASWINKNENSINRFLIVDDKKLTCYPLRFVHCNINYGLKQVGIKEQCLSVLQSDQTCIYACINCENEYRATTDIYTCGLPCRKEIELIKLKSERPTSDAEIREFQKLLLLS